MSKQWQIRRGTTAENDSFTGAIGELTMDTEKKQIRVHDGLIRGGIKIPSETTADYVVEWQAPTSDNNYTWYRKYRSGWVEQGGFCSGTEEDNPVTLAIEMNDTEYTIVATNTPTTAVNAWGWIMVSKDSKTTTGFSLGGRQGSGNVTPVRTHWQVSGIAA